MCYSLTIATVSSFFAQLIGFYLVLICLAMLLQPERFKKMMNIVLGHPASLYICSATNIIFGLTILIPHNIWVASWPLLITIIGWLTLLKGVFSLYFPEKYLKMFVKLMEKPGYQIWTWFWLFIGLYLAWMGLAQNM
jgi:uncharacterized membrane protein